MDNHRRCNAIVYKRDTYRRTGRGRTGFELSYTKEQCSRTTTQGERCWQHQGERWTTCPWATH